MAASAACRAAGVGAQVLLRPGRWVRWRRGRGAAGARGSGHGGDRTASDGSSSGEMAESAGKVTAEGRMRAALPQGDGGGPGPGWGKGRYPAPSSRRRLFPQSALLRAPALRGVATFAQAPQAAPETQVSVLDNGLRVASEHSAQPTCTVGVWIDAGSRYESEKNNGAGYFVEHLAFKVGLTKSVSSMGLGLRILRRRVRKMSLLNTNLS
ncbi:uncharacterized protein O8D03_012576 [Erethizon dorsatum]